MPIVLDSSYALALVLPDEQPPETAATVLDDDLIAPHLFPVEVANALLNGVRRKRYAASDAPDVCEAIERLSVGVLPASDLGAAHHLRIAQAHGLTAYDALYLDLALTRRCGMATRDKLMADAARKAGVQVYS